MSLHSDRSAGRVRELKAMVMQPGSRQQEIDILADLAWELRMSQPEQASALSRQAHDLAQSGEYASRPYARGLAASLVVQAFVDTFAGRLDNAASSCFEALSLLQHEPPSIISINVWFTLGWNNFFLSDYPIAVDNQLKALSIARELGERLHEAWALDALASCYGVKEDSSAIQLYQDALQIFRGLNDAQGELRTLNNLAVTLHVMRQYAAALEPAYQSWELARQYGLDADICNNSCTVAEILIEMGKLDEAEMYLREAMASFSHGPSVAQVNVLERWSRLCQLRKDWSGAESVLRQALELAQQLGARAEQAFCHKALSEVYEQQSQYSKALEQHQLFHRLHEEIAGDKAAQRLAVLKIMHQVESAQHETEIYRRQAVELQREIDERKRIQGILERLSTLDPLTEVHNRRYFDNILAREYSRHSRSKAELSLIMLDVDHFKAFNDAYGHVSGDKCLQQIAQVLRSAVGRSSDVIARYGGEEFICILPETGAKGALVVAETVRRRIMELAIPHCTSSTADVVTVSLGVVTAQCIPKASALGLIDVVDKQLYAAKSGGRNQVKAITVGVTASESQRQK